ncbi:hypothetical protein DOTSEDRAFT_68562 [Dothistroma septosporum NZE10]|uniref:Calcineurin-like phosphoesterase domain-containing protein n=1 Tax=Dothistroma septosporum (strain NZE10 / CBS 128990) TaxID=675120 RepID=N1Q3K2_DOTSN|nr:hypothetical protein DOTSEDRAFT_68562 [Dothistroma septosporum NZE10]
MDSTRIRIVCVSDTHNRRPGEGFTLPKGDVLIHAGDLTNQGSFKELKKAVDWISKADFSARIVVAGNHDLSLDPGYTLKHESGWKIVPANVEACRQLLLTNPEIVYLQHTEALVHLPEKGVSLRVFGSPYSPSRGQQNWAFQYSEGDASMIWSDIPSALDVLVTHTPPAGYLDESQHWTEGGCPTLATVLERARPMLHICGHCHEGRGALVVDWQAVNNGDTSTATLKWHDPGAGGSNRRQSMLDLTGRSPGGFTVTPGKTAIVNSSVMSRSHSRNGAAPSCNKPMVVDIEVSNDSAPSSTAA